MAMGMKKASHTQPPGRHKNSAAANDIAAVVCPEGKEYPPAGSTPASTQNL